VNNDYKFNESRCYSFLITSCSQKPILLSEQLLSGGSKNIWTISGTSPQNLALTNDACYKSDKTESMKCIIDRINASLDTQAKELCGSSDYRMFSCVFNDVKNSEHIMKRCYLECK